MAACDTKKRKDLRICSGDMDKLITVFIRSILPPDGDSVDFNEEFIEQRNIKAMVETTRGEAIFDGSNVLGDVTHKFTVRWQPNITFENFITFNNKRYKIVDVENQNERNQFYVIRANDRGDSSLEVNKA